MRADIKTKRFALYIIFAFQYHNVWNNCLWQKPILSQKMNYNETELRFEEIIHIVNYQYYFDGCDNKEHRQNNKSIIHYVAWIVW